MRCGSISHPERWPIVAGDPGWPKGLGFDDPAGPIMAEAVVTLVYYRGCQPLDNAGAALKALMDLIHVASASIPDAIACARDQYYSWGHIASVLGMDPDLAERRYGPYCDTRRWLDPHE